MTITLIAYGTRGDVQPILALAKGLAAVGRHVRIVAASGFRDWIENHGIEAAPTSIDVRETMHSEDGTLWVERGTRPFAQVRIMRRLVVRTYPAMMREAWEACRDASAIISTATSEPFGVAMAEKLGVPHVSALVAPAFVPTRSGAATWLAPRPRQTSIVNYAFGKLSAEAAFYRIMPDLVNRFRHEIGLPRGSLFRYAATARSRPVLLGYSPHVIPHPPDWPDIFHTTGYWFLDETGPWEPPRELVEFLAQGEPPVCIDFGSMTGRDPAGFTRLLVEAAIRSGRRVVLQSGWAGLGKSDLPSSVLPLGTAPHEWLFPRMAAVVHHGGSGTTASALRAGVPMVVVPHLGDQPLWGKRMEVLGVAPPAIPRPRLTAERLAAAIRAATLDDAMRRRAAELGETIRAEAGVVEAVRVLDRYLS